MHAGPIQSTGDAPGEALHAGASSWRWERELPETLASYADELLGGTYFRLRTTAPPALVAPALEAALDRLGIEDRPERGQLTADIGMLAELFADTIGCREVDVRVEHDPGARCPLFHQDNNVLRLMCTYAGPGTEWLGEAHVDRAQLGLGDRSVEAANEAIAVGPPERALRGEVVIAKGARFGRGMSTLVHKSPAAELGDRLFVAIDATPHDVGAHWHPRSGAAAAGARSGTPCSSRPALSSSSTSSGRLATQVSLFMRSTPCKLPCSEAGQDGHREPRRLGDGAHRRRSP